MRGRQTFDLHNRTFRLGSCGGGGAVIHRGSFRFRVVTWRGHSDFTQNVCNIAKLQKIYSQLVDELLRLTLRIQNIHFPFSFRTPTPHLSPKQRTFPAETFTELDHFDKFNNFLPLKCKTSNISSGSMYCWRPIYMIQRLIKHFLDGGHQPIIWPNFPRKLRESKRNLTEGGSISDAPLDPPMGRHAMAIFFFL